jgi:tRNA dimethylallyltransferase
MASSLGKLIAVIGPTASGKTALAIDIASHINGEIVCADSRTVYRKADIGTAKPSMIQQKQVQHHLLDIVNIDEPFSVADFKKLADDTIKDIYNRGKIPILVGGSGLYVDAVLYDYQFRPLIDPAARDVFQDLSIEELQIELKQRGIPLPENDKNRRYLIRSLEAGTPAPKNARLRENTLVIGLDIENDELQERSHNRARGMYEQGIIGEIIDLSHQFGWGNVLMQAPAYRAFRGVSEKTATVAEAIELCVQLDLKLAKKQRTWFKRNKSIHWLSDPSKYVDLLTTFLNN